MSFNFAFLASRTFINGYQLSLLNVELLFRNNYPLMKALSAKAFTFMFLRKFWAFKWKDVAHMLNLYNRFTSFNYFLRERFIIARFAHYKKGSR